MTNATGASGSEEVARAAAAPPPAAQPGESATDCQLLVDSVAAELDRLCLQMCGSGCTLSLTDSRGAVLYECSDGVSRNRVRDGRSAAPGALLTSRVELLAEP